MAIFQDTSQALTLRWFLLSDFFTVLSSPRVQFWIFIGKLLKHVKPSLRVLDTTGKPSPVRFKLLYPWQFSANVKVTFVAF